MATPLIKIGPGGEFKRAVAIEAGESWLAKIRRLVSKGRGKPKLEWVDPRKGTCDVGPCLSFKDFMVLAAVGLQVPKELLYCDRKSKNAEGQFVAKPMTPSAPAGLVAFGVFWFADRFGTVFDNPYDAQRWAGAMNEAYAMGYKAAAGVMAYDTTPKPTYGGSTPCRLSIENGKAAVGGVV
jgi:hypothetical protein